jgi:1-acyl-sn-glycerol-3-phosphate acyltransferase
VLAKKSARKSLKRDGKGAEPHNQGTSGYGGRVPEKPEGTRSPPRKNSWLASFATVVDTLRISGLTVVDSVRGRLDDKVSDDRIAWWARRVVAHAGLRVRVQGLGNRADGRAYVIMSNHQSHFDIPVLYYALGSNMRMVAKKELFDIPLFGRAMRESGFVEVDRGNKARAIESLDHAKDALDRGVSIWIAPEGTRSTTGALGSFKKGGFFLAMKTHAPILPVTVRGTHDVLPPHQLALRREIDVDVIVHEAIETSDIADGARARDELMQRVRAQIESAL